MDRRKSENERHVHEDRSTISFVSIIIILLIVSIATTIANILIIYKLNLLPGMEFFEYDSQSKELRLNRDTYIKKIFLEQNLIENVQNIVGDSELRSGDSSLKVNQKGIQIRAPLGFEVRSPSTGKRLYPFDIGNMTRQLLDSIQTLSVPRGIRDVKTIRSPKDGNLNIDADNIHIRGNEGVRLVSKTIDLNSSSVFFSSLNGSITIAAAKGVFLKMDSLKKHIVQRNDTLPTRPQNVLCVCSKNGRIFKMPIKEFGSTRCDDARFPQSENPCT